MSNLTHMVFVYPPASSAADEGRRTHFDFCLGSAYIISYLRQQGFSVRQLLSHEPMSAAACAARIAALTPKILGFTVDYSNYFFCQMIAKNLGKIAPGIMIMFGGIVPSMQPREVLESNPWVDICSRNESEETCLELLSRLDDAHFDMKRASLEGIRGITYRRGEQIFHNPDRKVLLANRRVPGFLDKYPSPYLTGIVNSHKMGIITARGCNQHCVFCACPVLSNHIIATHSVDRVILELDYIAAHLVQDKTAIVDIFDDTFTLLPDRALEICRKIIENKIKLSLACTTRCDKVNEELLETMKEAGFHSIEFSLESAVPRLLRKLGKVQPPDTRCDNHFEKEKEFIENLKKYVVYAKKIGIKKVYTSIMLGLPTETPQEGRQTMNLVQELAEYIDFYGHNILRVNPGTPLFFDTQRSGMEIPAYDTRQIPLAPRSSIEIMGINQDNDNIKSLALWLSPARKEKLQHTYFNKIILRGDIITGELLEWLQKYLAVNGSFIQVYSALERFRQYYRDNEKNLDTHQAPSNYYAAYYQDRSREDRGIIALTPSRTYFSSPRCGITFYLVDTAPGLLSAGEKTNPLHTVCIDRPGEKQDVLQLHGLLAELSQKENPLARLMDRPMLPFFSSLCRWENRLPNCQTLETIIVDAHHNIKTCWNGKPIGKVGMPLPEIIENLKNMHRETQKKRNCIHCHKKADCNACLFPSPLGEKEYCDLKKNFNITAAAELVRSVDMFRDLELGGASLYHADSF